MQEAIGEMMTEARRMEEKAVVMLCVSVNQICKRCCPFLLTWVMDKSRSVSRKHELRGVGGPCPTESFRNRKCLNSHLTERNVHDPGDLQ